MKENKDNLIKLKRKIILSIRIILDVIVKIFSDVHLKLREKYSKENRKIIKGYIKINVKRLCTRKYSDNTIFFFFVSTFILIFYKWNQNFINENSTGHWLLLANIFAFAYYLFSGLVDQLMKNKFNRLMQTIFLVGSVLMLIMDDYNGIISDTIINLFVWIFFMVLISMINSDINMLKYPLFSLIAIPFGCLIISALSEQLFYLFEYRLNFLWRFSIFIFYMHIIIFYINFKDIFSLLFNAPNKKPLIELFGLMLFLSVFAMTSLFFSIENSFNAIQNVIVVMVFCSLFYLIHIKFFHSSISMATRIEFSLFILFIWINPLMLIYLDMNIFSNLISNVGPLNFEQIFLLIISFILSYIGLLISKNIRHEKIYRELYTVPKSIGYPLSITSIASVVSFFTIGLLFFTKFYAEFNIPKYSIGLNEFSVIMIIGPTPFYICLVLLWIGYKQYSTIREKILESIINKEIVNIDEIFQESTKFLGKLFVIRGHIVNILLSHRQQIRFEISNNLNSTDSPNTLIVNYKNEFGVPLVHDIIAGVHYYFIGTLNRIDENLVFELEYTFTIKQLFSAVFIKMNNIVDNDIQKLLLDFEKLHQKKITDY